MHLSHILVIRLAFVKMVQSILEKPNKKPIPVSLTCKRIKHREWVVFDNKTEYTANGDSAFLALNNYFEKIKLKSIIPLDMNLVRDSGIVSMNLGTGKDGIDYGVCNNV